MDAATITVTPDNFQTEVVERSNSLPILLLFWAEQAPPSVQARQQIEALIGPYQGKAALALCDVAEDQTLAQHMQVRGLPALRVVHQGKIVDQIDGPIDETQIRNLLETLTQSPADMIKEQLAQIISSGDLDSAVKLLQQAVNEEPANMPFRVELADVLLLKGDLEDARQVLASIPEDTAERDRPQQRLEFIEEAAGLPGIEEIQQQLNNDGDNLELLYQRCVVQIVQGDFQTALEDALAILCRDREFRDDIGRLTMIRIFALLGKGHELSGAYRRKMFNFMH